MIAERPKAEQAACRSYGMNLGIAFQLVDDALDYGGTSAELGKNVGDDFREGKITLPVVLSFRRGTAGSGCSGSACSKQGDIDDGDLEEAIAIMRRHRALDDTVERARHYGAMARDALALFPDGPHEGGAPRHGRVLHRPGALRDRAHASPGDFRRSPGDPR